MEKVMTEHISVGEVRKREENSYQCLLLRESSCMP